MTQNNNPNQLGKYRKHLIMPQYQAFCPRKQGTHLLFVELDSWHILVIITKVGID